MTDSPASNSEGQVSRSFDRLDERIQRWLWTTGWNELRDAQERAIPLILKGTQDLIIAASTAFGKTEAAFLPILTRVAAPDSEDELAIYISPLKALINDQWRRLEELAEVVDIQVTPWHGDISQTKKTAFLKAPAGILLITPESLEALLMHHGHGLRGLLRGLRYLVVDELHAFMGTERGKQLQSLMHRIESALGRPVSRIGLSATLGDMNGAGQFLRPGGAPQIIVTKDKGQELKVQVRGILQPSHSPKDADGEDIDVGEEAIAKHLFEVLRGANHLVFPNSRTKVEIYSDHLRRMCEDASVPNEFWPHHGSLAKDIREETEAALKQKERPATAICTTTLELGIDIGSVKSIAQIGPPPSVASLRQRLGRSGRRKGEPAILRCYAEEVQLTDDASLSDQLREGLVQTTAMIQLLIDGWYEPVRVDGIHASTLVQQLLSAVFQHGGMKPGPLWTLLVETGPFRVLEQNDFADLLRQLGRDEILFQDPTGLLLIAPKGERIVQHYTFYAAFATSEEFRIVTSGKSIGSMPISQPLQEGSHLIFAGRRWEVLSVSMEDLTIEVTPSRGGNIPFFDNPPGSKIHRRVREKMREILGSRDLIPFLDPEAQALLREARDTYERLGLANRKILKIGRTTYLMHWSGDAAGHTLTLWLEAKGLKAIYEGLSITVPDVEPSELMGLLGTINEESDMTGEVLAETVVNKAGEKWDYLLPGGLLNKNFASLNLDWEEAANLSKCLGNHYEANDSPF